MSAALTLPRPAQGLAQRAAIAARGLGQRAGAVLRAYPRESAGFGLLGAVALAVGAAQLAGANEPQLGAAPPAPPPMAIRKLAPEQALAVNQSIPLAGGSGPAATPFRFTGSAGARASALECLTSAVYYEAGNEIDDGKRAVAQVVLNRARHAAFPGTVCGVVYQGSTRVTGCQFTFTCDGSLARTPSIDGWNRARKIAGEALAGAVYAPVGWATHYHANYVVPYWASTLAKNAIVGAHLFYRWAGGWGQPAAFRKAYGGHEPSAAALRSLALAAEAVTVAPQQGGVAAGVAAVLEEVPGAERLAPSMRGDKRVAVRFNQVARKASDEAPRKAYVEKFEASDTLRWALSGDSAVTGQAPLGQKPLGKPAVASSGGAAGVSAQR
jgi:spore germination cell wall hydrolase CwlJ-like protein